MREPAWRCPPTPAAATQDDQLTQVEDVIRFDQVFLPRQGQLGLGLPSQLQGQGTEHEEHPDGLDQQFGEQKRVKSVW